MSQLGSRPWAFFRFAAMLMGFSLLAGNASADGLRFLEPDLQLPGAEVRFGWGGGFFNGAWNEFVLWANAAGEYRAVVEGREGSLRNGYTKFQATLKLPDGAGVRSRRLLVPVFSRQTVLLRLEGPTGSKSLRLEPLKESRLLSGESFDPMLEQLSSALVYGPDLPSDPALWLSQPELLIRATAPPNANTVLALLAAGGQVVGPNTGGLTGIPFGDLGLGKRLKSANASVGLRSIQKLLEALPKPQHVVEHPLLRMAWWVLAVFAASVLVFAQRRDQNALLGSASVALGCAVLGFVAWQPKLQTHLRERVLIGSGGWGLEITHDSVANLQAGNLELPPMAQPLQAVARQSSIEFTSLKLGAWQTLRYWLPPKAKPLPLRSLAGELRNSINEPIVELFVVGSGPQEVIGKRQRIKTLELNPSNRLTQLALLLPVGTALAQTSTTLYIALPET